MHRIYKPEQDGSMMVHGAIMLTMNSNYEAHRMVLGGHDEHHKNLRGDL